MKSNSHSRNDGHISDGVYPGGYNVQLLQWVNGYMLKLPQGRLSKAYMFFLYIKCRRRMVNERVYEML